MPTKVHMVKAMAFPVVMYGCESWTIKKTKCQRNDAFELWCWWRLSRVPWFVRRSKQSILKEINPEHSLKGMLMKIKLQYFGHVIWRADSLDKTDSRKDRGQEEKGGRAVEDEMVGSLTQWTWIWANSETVKDREAWCAVVHGVAKSWTRRSDYVILSILHLLK